MVAYSHSAIIAVYNGLLGNDHFLHAVTADYVDCFRRSAAIATFGANVFAGATGLFGSAPALGERSEHIQQGNTLDHLQVLPALLLDEIQQVNSGAGNCPTVFGVMNCKNPPTLLRETLLGSELSRSTQFSTKYLL